jgi:hypothetical protein
MLAFNARGLFEVFMFFNTLKILKGGFAQKLRLGLRVSTSIVRIVSQSLNELSRPELSQTNSAC